MRIRVMVVLICVLTFNSFVGWAQIGRDRPDPGSRRPFIEGTVVDQNGAPIPSARVMVTLFGAGTGLTGFSNDDGRFFFYELSERTYNVSVSATGFVEATQSVNLTYGPQNIRFVLRRRDSSPTAAPAQSVAVTDLAVPAKARARYQKGMKELERKEFENSVKHFQAAIQEYPRYAAAYSALGIAYIQMRKIELAREAFEKALGLNENSAEAQLGLGLVCNDEKRYAEAEKHLLKAQQLNPADWHVHYELGRAYYGLDQLENAEKRLRLARKAHPDYGNLYLLLANVLVLQHKYAEGLAEMEEFLKVAPNSPLAPQVREKTNLLKAELANPQL